MEIPELSTNQFLFVMGFILPVLLATLATVLTIIQLTFFAKHLGRGRRHRGRTCISVTVWTWDVQYTVKN
jgi:hypothetical protein